MWILNEPDWDRAQRVCYRETGISHKRRSLLHTFTYILVIVALTYLGIFLFAVPNSVAAQISVTIGILGLLLPKIYPIINSLAAATHLLVGVVFISVTAIVSVTGGTYSPMSVWIAIIPIPAMLLIGPKAGLFWLIGVIAETAFLSAIAATSEHLLSQQEQHLYTISVVGLAACVFACLFVEYLNTYQAQKSLQFQAHHDGLTHLLNHRTTLSLLAQATRDGKIRNTTTAIIMLDVDYFKDVNDRYGHVIGDRVLQATARRVERCLRPIDYIGRYGGEEFLCVLPDSSLEQSTEFAECIRSRIEDTPFQIGDLEVRITVSLGVAVNEPGGDADGLQALRRADNALYRAKQEGRNRTYVDGGQLSKPSATAATSRVHRESVMSSNNQSETVFSARA